MKIVLVSNYAADRQESMLRYAELLAKELAARGHDVRVLHPPALLLRLFGHAGFLAKWIAYIDKYLLAPAYLRSQTRDADIIHICDHSNSMYLWSVADRPKLITCHDTLAIFAARGRFPGIQVGVTGRILQRWIARGLTHAPLVVCVSRKTQQDLAELSGSRTHPASAVISNPVSPLFAPVPAGSSAAVLARQGLSSCGAYFLHVGSNSWYKNRAGAVRIFAGLAGSERYGATCLLLVGKAADDELRTAILESGASERIHVLEDVADSELRALYADAEALLFLSREEGFGWPILEAQACGCVVVTSSREPMREIAGGAAILVDPDRPLEEAATVLAAAAEGRFDELRRHGFANVLRFQAGPAIDDYLRVYEGVREEHARRHGRGHYPRIN